MTISLEDDLINLDGDSDWEAEVNPLVRRALSTQIGRAIVTKIRAHGKVLITQDYPGTDRRELNAEAMSAQKEDLAIVSFHPADLIVGTAIYNGTARSENWVKQYTRAPGMLPDELIIHELVHAGRRLGGDQSAIHLTGDMQGWETEEEFFAIMVTNIYSSEMNRDFRHFRRSHKLVWAPEMTAAEVEPWMFLFASDNYRLIDKYCKQHPTIAPMIADAQADFNPVRDYFDFKRGRPPVSVRQEIEEIQVPIRITQAEARVPITDSYLLSLLAPRFGVDDVAGYGGRARGLESVFRQIPLREALPLLGRLIARPRGDKVAMYFHAHLSAATRMKLQKILALSAVRS